MATSKELFLLQVADLSELISGCDEIITKMLSMGYSKDSSQIRQELYLKHRYCEELTSLFRKQNILIHIVEDELRQAA